MLITRIVNCSVIPYLKVLPIPIKDVHGCHKFSHNIKKQLTTEREEQKIKVVFCLVYVQRRLWKQAGELRA